MKQHPFGLSLSKPHQSAWREPFDKLRANGNGGT
jgi:hypothetical protein